jgi:hypothetical protein
VDCGTDSEDDETFMALAYDRSADPATGGVSVDRLAVPAEETKSDGGPADPPVLTAAHPASVHPEGSMLDDVLDDDAAADPIAAEGVTSTIKTLQPRLTVWSKLRSSRMSIA